MTPPHSLQKRANGSVGRGAKQLVHLQQFTHCYGYLPTNFPSLEELLESNNECLFTAIWYYPQHILCQLFPPPKQTGYNLHLCDQGLTLPKIKSGYIWHILSTGCCTETFTEEYVIDRDLVYIVHNFFVCVGVLFRRTMFYQMYNIYCQS